MKEPSEIASDVPALDRGLSVLEYVMEASQPVSMKDISRSLAIPAASAFRLTRNLVQRGYIEEISTSQQFFLPGNKLFKLVQFYQLNHSLHSVARLPLRTLAERTGQTAQLALLKGSSVIYIEQAIPKEPVSIIAALHSFVPINVSAAGKILCGQFEGEALKKILTRENLKKKTKNTITTAQALVDDISVSRARGYATDLEEFARGIGCMASAIWDSQNNCIGAIGVTGHIEEYQTKESFDHIVKSVLAVAHEVSQLMGYAGPYPRK